MATLHFDEHSTVTFGGVDVSSYVTTITMEQAPYVPHEPLRPLYTPNLWLRLCGELDPVSYRAFWRRTHPRIRRMHAAYRQRKRGRW